MFMVIAAFIAAVLIAFIASAIGLGFFPVLILFVAVFVMFGFVAERVE